MDQERRHFTRVSFQRDAYLEWHGGSATVAVRDLSLNGALLSLPPDWDGSDREIYHLTIPLADDISIHMQLTLAHHRGRVAGFHCHRLDLDSMSHLRRLVELNMQDPSLLRRQLADLIHETP